MHATPERGIANMHEQLALPRQNGELVFAAPWEARAFGMAVALNDSGRYDWHTFSQGLAAETARTEQHGVSVPYYERWLATLEKLLHASGLVTPAELQHRVAEYAAGMHDDHHDHDHTHAV
jgi:nitrile hydratase accessory protein